MRDARVAGGFRSLRNFTHAIGREGHGILSEYETGRKLATRAVVDSYEKKLKLEEDHPLVILWETADSLCLSSSPTDSERQSVPPAPPPVRSPDPAPRPDARRNRVLAGGVVAAVLLGGGLAGILNVGRDNGTKLDPTTGSTPAPTSSPAGSSTISSPSLPGHDVVVFTFDELPVGAVVSADRVVDRSANGNDGKVLVQSGGGITVVARTRPGDKAIKFPGPCAPGPAGECPRAIIQTDDPSNLNVGDGDFAYGADVLVTAAEVSPGAAILNKGRITRPDDSEWNLQLEPDGRASCTAVVGAPGPSIQAVSAVGIADGSWHRVTCTRTGNELRIDVDGGTAGRATLPDGFRFESEAPLRLGGNSNRQDNAQFSGALDNVFFRLGR